MPAEQTGSREAHQLRGFPLRLPEIITNRRFRKQPG
jgi:hypothetical protein